MPWTKQIDAYTVIYSANSFSPRIGLKQGAVFLGQCVFHPNGTTLPPDLLRPNGQVDLQYHLDDFHNVLDVLRNEKPVFLNFNGVGPGFENNINTGPETVGEGDQP
jgi:hypothetical protein